MDEAFWIIVICFVFYSYLKNHSTPGSNKNKLGSIFGGMGVLYVIVFIILIILSLISFIASL